MNEGGKEAERRKRSRRISKERVREGGGSGCVCVCVRRGSEALVVDWLVHLCDCTG